MNIYTQLFRSFLINPPSSRMNPPNYKIKVRPLSVSMRLTFSFREPSTISLPHKQANLLLENKD